MTVIDREACEQRDRNDPLARFRDRFRLPAGLIYLDGNSLDPLPTDLPRQIAETIERDWGERTGSCCVRTTPTSVSPRWVAIWD